MKTAKIGELRNALSRFLAYVRKGGRVRVYDRDEPIAEIVPIGAEARRPGATIEAVMADLERAGSVRRGTGGLPPGFLTCKLPKARRSVVEAVLEERREGW